MHFRKHIIITEIIKYFNVFIHREFSLPTTACLDTEMADALNALEHSSTTLSGPGLNTASTASQNIVEERKLHVNRLKLQIINNG